MKLFISFKNFLKKCSQWSNCGSEVAHWLYFATHSQHWPTSVLLPRLSLFTMGEDTRSEPTNIPVMLCLYGT